MSGSLSMEPHPLPTALRSGQLVGTGGRLLFLLARTVAFWKAGASSLGWWVGRALGWGTREWAGTGQRTATQRCRLHSPQSPHSRS